MEDKITTMNIKRSTIDALRKREVHHRETHEEIILRLLKEVKQK